MSETTHSSDSLVSLARGIAIGAHAGQTDKGKRPYIDHVARVASRVEPYGPDFVMVAWLHDVIEDTDVTPEDLRDAGFSRDVVEGVRAMTKREDEEHREAVARAAENPYGRVVKAADVADNSDPERQALLEEQLARQRDRYRRAREVLDRYGAPQFN